MPATKTTKKTAAAAAAAAAALSPNAFTERVRGKSAAFARAEELRRLGRKAAACHWSGPMYIVQVLGLDGSSPAPVPGPRRSTPADEPRWK